MKRVCQLILALVVVDLGLWLCLDTEIRDRVGMLPGSGIVGAYLELTDATLE